MFTIMLYDLYFPHQTKPDHAFLKILIPYSSVSRFDETNLDHFPARIFLFFS